MTDTHKAAADEDCAACGGHGQIDLGSAAACPICGGSGKVPLGGNDTPEYDTAADLEQQVVGLREALETAADWLNAMPEGRYGAIGEANRRKINKALANTDTTGEKVAAVVRAAVEWSEEWLHRDNVYANADRGWRGEEAIDDAHRRLDTVEEKLIAAVEALKEDKP